MSHSYGWQLGAGNLYITFSIDFPEYLDMHDKEGLVSIVLEIAHSLIFVLPTTDLIGIFGSDQLLNTELN